MTDLDQNKRYLLDLRYKNKKKVLTNNNNSSSENLISSCFLILYVCLNHLENGTWERPWHQTHNNSSSWTPALPSGGRDDHPSRTSPSCQLQPGRACRTPCLHAGVSESWRGRSRLLPNCAFQSCCALGGGGLQRAGMRSGAGSDGIPT